MRRFWIVCTLLLAIIFVQRIAYVPILLTISPQESELLLKIKQVAKTREIKPKNAVIDPIWKAMPGLNGLQVDVDKSLKNMDGQFERNKLIYKQISPTVHLQDLSPSPIYRGHPDKPMVSLLINVAWGNEYIPKMLDILKKHDAKATFFLEGKWAEKNPLLVNKIVENGHEIGNHSYSHPDMKTLSNAKISYEIRKTNEIIKKLTGETPKYFAPPSGSFRQDVVEIAHDQGLYTILWSVDTVDWTNPTPSALIERVVSKLHNGALILMHPTLSTTKSLDQLMTTIEKKYKIGNVSTLLDEERIH